MTHEPSSPRSLLVPPPRSASYEDHAALHQQYGHEALHQIEAYRVPVGIQPMWSLGVKIFCSQEYPQYEGWCTWDEEKFFAEMGLCCALSPEGLSWVLLTELFELQGYREGNWVAQMVDTWVPTKSEGDRLLREFQFVRNQTIEERVSALLGGKHRPQSLRASYER